MDTKRTRGGQRKHWAEKARVWAWYGEVKRRCNLTDYQLDNEFAWRTKPDKVPTSDERPRAFEWIRRVAREPRGLDPRWRSMDELVAAVEQDSRFQGTLVLYQAEIWDLLQETRPTLAVAQYRVDEILAANKLVRLPVENVFDNSVELIAKFGLPTLYDGCLRRSLRQVDQLSAIGLLWSLFTQTEPVHNAPIRAVIEAILDRLLGLFFLHYLPDNHFEYYADAIGELFQVRLDLNIDGVTGYGSLETVGVWLIVPDGLAGKMTKIDLSLLKTTPIA